MLDVIITKDGVKVASFENQNSDFCAFRYMLAHQSQSIHWAVRYEGWDAIITDKKTGNVSRYSDDFKNYNV